MKVAYLSVIAALAFIRVQDKHSKHGLQDSHEELPRQNVFAENTLIVTRQRDGRPPWATMQKRHSGILLRDRLVAARSRVGTGKFAPALQG